MSYRWRDGRGRFEVPPRSQLYYHLSPMAGLEWLTPPVCAAPSIAGCALALACREHPSLYVYAIWGAPDRPGTEFDSGATGEVVFTQRVRVQLSGTLDLTRLRYLLAPPPFRLPSRIERGYWRAQLEAVNGQVWSGAFTPAPRAERTVA